MDEPLRECVADDFENVLIDQRLVAMPAIHVESRTVRKQVPGLCDVLRRRGEVVIYAIAPGKLADLTVLSADIMKIPEPEILQTRCTMTSSAAKLFSKKRSDKTATR
jgi:hypothetical protein